MNATGREDPAKPDPASGAGARLVAGTLWSGASVVGARGAGFLAVVVAARLLGREALGRYGYLQATLATFVVLGSMGMSVASARFVALHRATSPDRAREIAWDCIRLAAVAGGFLSLLVFIAAPALATRVLADASLAPALRLLCVAMVFASVAAAQVGVLGGLEAFRTVAVANLVVGVTTLVATTAGAYLAGLDGAVWSLVLGPAAQCVFQDLAIRRRIGRSVRSIMSVDWPQFRAVLGQGVPAMLSGLLVLPTAWGCSALLVNQPDGYKHMAGFAVADQWFQLLLTLPAMFGQVFLPVLSSELASRPLGQLRGLIVRSFGFTSAFSLIPAGAVAALAGFILRLYGTDYAGVEATLVISVVGGACAASISPAGQILLATSRAWLGLFMNVGWALAFVGGTLWWVVFEQRGSAGLALARTVAYVLHAGWAGLSVWWLLSRDGRRGERGT